MPKASIRIKGLVRIARLVKEQLDNGVPENRLEDFKKTVTSAVDKVEHICGRNAVTPDHLPLPSRRAYYALKAVRFEDVPTRPAPVRQETIRIKNGVHNLNVFHHRVNKYVSAGEPESAVPNLLPRVNEWLQQFDSILDTNNTGAHSLETRTGRAYALFKLLSSEERLRHHVNAVHCLHRLSKEAEFRLEERPVFVELGLFGHLYMSEVRKGARLYQVDVGYVEASEEVFTDLLRCIHQRKPSDASRRFKKYQMSESYQSITSDLELLLEPPEGAVHGRAYDLSEVFDAVNRTYFGGNMPKPRMRWSRRETFRKFGHYSFMKDEVMLSSTLDNPGVPRFVVEFVMYHELLHKKHGLRRSGSKNFAHTREFRAEERRFPRYKEAEAAIQKLSEAKRRAMY